MNPAIKFLLIHKKKFIATEEPKTEESRQTTDIPFVNEIVMNDNTLRKIMLDLWTHKTGRNRLPPTLQPDTLGKKRMIDI